MRDPKRAHSNRQLAKQDPLLPRILERPGVDYEPAIVPKQEEISGPYIKDRPTVIDQVELNYINYLQRQKAQSVVLVRVNERRDRLFYLQKDQLENVINQLPQKDSGHLNLYIRDKTHIKSQIHPQVIVRDQDQSTNERVHGL